MFQIKYPLCEEYHGFESTSGSGSSKAKSSKKTSKPSKEKEMEADYGAPRRKTTQRRAKTETTVKEENSTKNVVKLASGLSVKLVPKHDHPAEAYKGDTPLMKSFTLGANVNHLDERDMADLLSQIGATSVTLGCESSFSDLSFLPEDVQYLDASKAGLKAISKYVNAPSTLHTINFSSSSIDIMKFDKLNELISSGVSFDLRISKIQM